MLTHKNTSPVAETDEQNIYNFRKDDLYVDDEILSLFFWIMLRRTD